MKYKGLIILLICFLLLSGCKKETSTFEDEELLIDGRLISYGGVSSLDSVTDYPNLKELSICNMEIESYEALSQNNTITKLILDNNTCYDLSPISTIPNLEALVIFNSSGIEDFSCLSSNKSLWYLAISDTKVLPGSGVFKLDQLQCLLVDNSSLKNIEGIENLQHLNTIFILNNQIEDISLLSKLHDLMKVYLNNNEISNIDALKELANLEYLGLDGNDITDLSPLYNLKKLKLLRLVGNPLTQEQIDDLQAALPNCEIVFETQQSS